MKSSAPFRPGIALLAFTAASTALAAHAAPGPSLDVTGTTSLTSATPTNMSSTSDDVVAGCIAAGSRVIVPINVSVRNVGSIGWHTNVVPAGPCAGCQCPGQNISGPYIWSNRNCRWEVKNFIDFAITDQNDVRVYTPTVPAVAKSQCIDDNVPGNSVNRCVQNYTEGQELNTSSSPHSNACRFIDMQKMPANGNFRYTVTVNQAGWVPEDRSTNNTIVGTFSIVNGALAAGSTSLNGPDVTFGNVSVTPTTISSRPHEVFVISPSNGIVRVVRKAFGQKDATVNLPSDVKTDDPVAAVSWGPGRIDIFVRGRDGRLYHNWTDGLDWQFWEPMGGPSMVSPPAVVSWAPGRLDLVYINNTGAMTHFWYQGGWGAETFPDGGPFTGRPSIVSRTPGQLYVVAKDTNNMVWVKAYPDPGFSPDQWAPFKQPNNNVTCHGSPAVTAYGTQEAMILACRHYDTLRVYKLAGQPLVVTPSNITTAPVRSDPVAIGWNQGTSKQWAVYFQGTDNKLYDVRSTDGGANFGSPIIIANGVLSTTGIPAGVYSWGIGRVDVAYNASSTSMEIVNWY